MKLFKYFCEHKRSVIISDYTKLAKEIKEVLLPNNIGFIPMMRLLPNVESIILTEISISNLAVMADNYTDAVVEYLKSKVDAMKLQRIEFKAHNY